VHVCIVDDNSRVVLVFDLIRIHVRAEWRRPPRARWQRSSAITHADAGSIRRSASASARGAARVSLDFMPNERRSGGASINFSDYHLRRNHGL